MAARSTRYAEFPRTTTATPFSTSAFYSIGLGLVPMVAVAPLFLAECQRRGAPSSRDRGFFQGGSYLVLLRPLRPGTRLRWLAAALALWGWRCGASCSPFRSGSPYGMAGSTMPETSFGYSGSYPGSSRQASLARSWGRSSRQSPTLARLHLRRRPRQAAGLYWSAARYRGDDTSGCVLRIDQVWLTSVLWVPGVSAVLSLVGILNSWRSGKSLDSLGSVS